MELTADAAERVDVFLQLPDGIVSDARNPRAVALATGKPRTLEFPEQCERWGA